MEDPGTERLSRLIDGDLDPKEIEETTAALQSDRVLRREYEGLKRVRVSLLSLADRERPPDRLDTLVDPLLRGKPETAVGWPWVRRLAAAAVVVFGVSVVIQFQRSQPEPAIHNWQERAREGAAAEPTERFALAPLPTSSVPADEQPLGAADRLVAAPEPQIEPVMAPAPPLEVLGPLDAGTTGDAAGRATFGELGGELSGQPESVEESAARVTAKRGDTGPPIAAPPESATTRAEVSRGLSPSLDTDAMPAGAQLFIFMAAETAWRSFEPEVRCEAGRYSLRIRVENGVVREVWPVANPPAPTRQVRASQLVLGLEVDNVADGEYAAEVVIEPRRATQE